MPMPGTKVHSAKLRARQTWGTDTNYGAELITNTGGMLAVFWRLAGVWYMVADPMTANQYTDWDRTANQPTEALPDMQIWLDNAMSLATTKAAAETTRRPRSKAIVKP